MEKIEKSKQNKIIYYHYSIGNLYSSATFDFGPWPQLEIEYLEGSIKDVTTSSSGFLGKSRASYKDFEKALKTPIWDEKTSYDNRTKVIANDELSDSQKSLAEKGLLKENAGFRKKPTEFWKKKLSSPKRYENFACVKADSLSPVWKDIPFTTDDSKRYSPKNPTYLSISGAVDKYPHIKSNIKKRPIRPEFFAEPKEEWIEYKVGSVKNKETGEINENGGGGFWPLPNVLFQYFLRVFPLSNRQFSIF